MTYQWARNGLVVVILASVLTAPARAQGIVQGQTVLPWEAIQDDHPPARHAVQHDRVADPDPRRDRIRRDHAQPRRSRSETTITFGSLAGGMYYGSNALLGSYVFGNIATPDRGGLQRLDHQRCPELRPTPAMRPASRPASSRGTSRSGAPASGSSSSSPDAGARLFTDPSVPFSFSATFDGLPPSPGTVLLNSGPDVLNVQLNGQDVATSSDRRIIILASVPDLRVWSCCVRDGVLCGFAGPRKS